MSPEIVYQQSHGFAVDIWCLGILLFEMLHGSPPFKAENLDQIKGEFRSKRLKINPGIDPDVVDLIKKLLNFDANSRIRIAEVLEHRAFQKNLWQITRPISQQEFKLLVKYYFLNSGGTNLDTHKKEFASQYPRESSFRRPAPKKPASPLKPITLRDFTQAGAKSSKNNFEPAKFQTPADPSKKTGACFNDFQPKKFMTPLKTAEASKPKIPGSKANDHIKNYEPPNFVEKKTPVKERDSRFKKKKEPVVEVGKVETKRKFSGLKKKLQNQEKRNYVDKGGKLKKGKDEGKFKTLNQLRKGSENRPLQARSMSLQKMLNTSLVGMKSVASNKRINLSNYMSNPVNSMSFNRTKTQGNELKPNTSANINTARTNRFQNKEKGLKRDTSQSIEKAMNIRVIKASASLPKTKFINFKAQNIENSNYLKKQMKKNLLKKKILGNTLNSFRITKPEKKVNIQNFSSINYKADEVIPEELYLSQFQTIQQKKESTLKPIVSKVKKEPALNPSIKKIPEEIPNKPIIRSGTNVKKTSTIQGSNTSLSKISVSMMSSTGLQSRRKIGENLVSTITKLEARDLKKGVSIDSRSTEVSKPSTIKKIHKSENLNVQNPQNPTKIDAKATPKSQESLKNYFQSNSMFQDYNFTSSSQVKSQLSSQNFSKKDISSIQSISETPKDLKQDTVSSHKTRDIAFNTVASKATTLAQKKPMEKYEKKLSDIHEETNTLKTHTSTLKDAPIELNEASRKVMDKEMTEKKKNPRKSQHKNPVKTAPKYVKRVFYVNGVKKIQMILSKGKNSPVRKTNKNMQQYLEQSRQERSNGGKSKRSISITKKAMNISKPTVTPPAQTTSKTPKVAQPQEVQKVKSQKSSNGKSSIQWVNYSSPPKRVTLQERQTIPTPTIKDSLNKSNDSHIKKLLDKVQNLQTSNQQALLNKRRVIEPKSEIPMKKNFKNHSYGIGDNLQKLISENRPNFNAARFENSFIIQPDLEAKDSPSRSINRDSFARKGVPTTSSASRYSTNRDVGGQVNGVQNLRQSIPFKPNLSANEQGNYRSNQWMNYNFVSSEKNTTTGKIFLHCFVVFFEICIACHVNYLFLRFLYP